MLNKILKVIIALVLVSGAVLTYFGLTNTQKEMTTEITVEAPVDLVYEYLTDPGKSAMWIESLTDVKLIEGDSMAVGSKYRVKFKEGKRDLVMTETITAVEENERFAFALEDDFMDSHVDITVEPVAGGTLVREVNTYSGKGFMARAMTGMFNGRIRKQKTMMYEKLKEVVESADAD